ncbi:b-box zinc finger protein [Anaeramoeba flamelloides]|uniref:B-box zinc finger protein n=1 Tax=Anaeramoeba flamelloides TaxID=1746091 RepID=A0ABQ8ZCD5_9EUKA|nr:b-box zinc finger protein [Anaeramoeba flamelloides]
MLKNASSLNEYPFKIKLIIKQKEQENEKEKTKIIQEKDIEKQENETQDKKEHQNKEEKKKKTVTKHKTGYVTEPQKCNFCKEKDAKIYCYKQDHFFCRLCHVSNHHEGKNSFFNLKTDKEGEENQETESTKGN